MAHISQLKVVHCLNRCSPALLLGLGILLRKDMRFALTSVHLVYPQHYCPQFMDSHTVALFLLGILCLKKSVYYVLCVRTDSPFALGIRKGYPLF